MLIIIGLLIGLLLGLFANIPLPASMVPYLAIFSLIGAEALTGSWNAVREGKFESGSFLIEIAANLAVASLITALGNQMKYDFSLIVSFIFAYRLFRNVTFISRRLHKDVKVYLKNRARKSDDETAKEG
jgi:small basic protein